MTEDLVYKTTIQSTPDQVWEAITNPEFTKQYWFGYTNVSSWEKGAVFNHQNYETGKVVHTGEVLESDKPHKLVVSWHNPDDNHDVSKVTFAITQTANGVELVITHGDFVADSEMAKRVSGGWPKVVAGLKEFLETGMAEKRVGCA